MEGFCYVSEFSPPVRGQGDPGRWHRGNCPYHRRSARRRRAARHLV